MVATATFLIEILAIITYCHEITVHANDETNAYRAAVVEYFTVNNGETPENIFNANANNYVKFIEKASEYNADIIVFPENGITDGRRTTNRDVYPNWSSYIPDSTLSVNPCIDYSETIQAIKTISCAARNHSMYVMINLSEKKNCSSPNEDCEPDGYLFYNTNVVFNRNGTIIARYRKYNLFGEIGFNQTDSPDLVTFETDFGVTFGIFMAFDILFKEPSLTLVRDLNVTHFLYNLHWFSALPFMTAVQTVMAWAYTLDVDVLASGYNRPISGGGGSGIFAGRLGSMVSNLPDTNSNLLLLADVPKNRSLSIGSRNESLTLVYDMSDIISTTSNSTSQLNLRRDNLEPYTTLEIDPTVEEHDIRLCDRGLCCEFSAKTCFTATREARSVPGRLSDSTAVYYRYRFAVFNGVRDYSGIRTGGIQTCALFACTGDDIASCGLRLSTDSVPEYVTRFENLSISGAFPNDENKLQIVQSLTSNDLLPLTADRVSLEINSLENDERVITFRSIQPEDDLLTFAIYGRNFDADGLDVTTVDESTPNQSVRSEVSVTLLIALSCSWPSIIHLLRRIR